MSQLPALPSAPVNYTDELIKEIAMDIGKDTVDYIEWMYPKALEAVSASMFKLALRNHIYNQIIEAIKYSDEGQIISRLAERKKHRRLIKKMRKASSMEEIISIKAAMEGQEK